MFAHKPNAKVGLNNQEEYRLRVTALSLVLLACGLAHAETMIISYDTPLFPGSPPTYQPGNQFNSAGLWLGLDFEVNVPILIDAMGYFDGSGDGVQGTGIRVAIRNRTGDSIVAGTDFTFTGMMGYLVNNNRFYDLTAPVLLEPGQYSVVAAGFGVLDPNINLSFTDPAPKLGAIMNDGGGLISFVGHGRYGTYQNGNFVWNDVVPGPTRPPNLFGAGTFRYSAAVPEPSFFGPLGLAFAAFLCVRLRGQRLR